MSNPAPGSPLFPVRASNDQVQHQHQHQHQHHHRYHHAHDRSTQHHEHASDPESNVQPKVPLPQADVETFLVFQVVDPRGVRVGITHSHERRQLAPAPEELRDVPAAPKMPRDDESVVAYSDSFFAVSASSAVSSAYSSAFSVVSSGVTVASSAVSSAVASDVISPSASSLLDTILPSVTATTTSTPLTITTTTGVSSLASSINSSLASETTTSFVSSGQSTESTYVSSATTELSQTGTVKTTSDRRPTTTFRTGTILTTRSSVKPTSTTDNKPRTTSTDTSTITSEASQTTESPVPTSIATNTDDGGYGGAGGYGGGDYGGTAPAVASSTISASTGASTSQSKATSSPPAVIAGASVGAIAGAAMFLLVALVVFRWKKRRDAMHLEGGHGGSPGVGGILGGMVGMKRQISRPRGMSETASRRSAPFAVPSTLTNLVGAARRHSQKTNVTSSTEGGEKGFQKVSGRKLPSVFQYGGDGFSEPPGPRDSIVSEQSSYRNSQNFHGGLGMQTLAVGSPMRPVSGIPIFHPSPARTPQTEDGHFGTVISSSPAPSPPQSASMPLPPVAETNSPLPAQADHTQPSASKFAETI